MRHPHSKPWITIVWCLWLCVALALFAQPFHWHLQIFQIAGPIYAKIILFLVPSIAAAAWGYHYLRQKFLWRYEPRIIAGVCLAIPILYAPRATATCALMVLAALSIGGWAAAWSRMDIDPATRLLVGFGVLICLLFPLGILHAYYWPVLLFLLGIPIALGRGAFAVLAKQVRQLDQAWQSDASLRDPLVSVSVFFGVIFAALCVVSAITPTMNGDGVMMHLPLVRSFTAAHGLTLPPTMVYAYYPQGVEMLMSCARILGGEVGPQLLVPVFFGAALVILVRIARLCGASRPGAIAGVALAASIPFLHWSGSVLKNDIAFSAFELAALAAALRWRETQRFAWILLSVWLIAIAFQIKLVALFGTVPLAVLWLMALWKQPRKLAAGLLVLGVFAGFATWFAIRTWLLTGDPAYPETLRHSVQFPGRVHNASDLALRYLRSISTSQFAGKTMFESPTENPMGMAFVLFAPVWILGGIPKRPAWWICLLFSVAYLLYWRLEAGTLRYAIPAIALLAMLLGERLASAKVPLRTPALGLALVFSMLVTVVIEMYPAQVRLFAGRIGRSEFLLESLPPFGAVNFIAHHVSADDWTLSIGAWCPGYAANPDRFDLVYRPSRLYTIADIQQRLAKNSKFRWIILPKKPNGGELAGSIPAAQMVYSDDWFSVYRL